jgi:hypothetical protein
LEVKWTGWLHLADQRLEAVELESRIHALTKEIGGSPDNYLIQTKERAKLNNKKRELHWSALSSWREDWFSGRFVVEAQQRLQSGETESPTAKTCQKIQNFT